MQYLKGYEGHITEAQLTLLEIYQHSYFQEIVLLITVLLSFIVGRLAYENKLTTLLGMVNDSDKSRKQFIDKLTLYKDSLKSTKLKRPLLMAFSVFLVLANAAFFYITNNIDFLFIGGSLALILLIWIAYAARVRYLEWCIRNLEGKLRSISITAEAELKQIISIFGKEVTNKMKTLFESDIDIQWMKESKESCRLAKCSNEKQAYKQLYNLYEEIINQIKQINYCDVCLSQENISVQKLGVGELDLLIRNCKKALSGSVGLEQKKQIINRLLLEYQKMLEKLPFVCKKGCCVRQRALIEATKAKYHQKLKRSMSLLQK